VIARRSYASISIACDGSAPGVIRSGPGGLRRLRTGAQLQNVVADAQYWHKIFKEDVDPPGAGRHILLENPTKKDVLDALDDVGSYLEESIRVGAPGWPGGELHFAFSGHGTDDGKLELADNELSATELVDSIVAPMSSAKYTRRIGVVFDSCYSGLTLAQLLLHPETGRHISLRDGFAAALHDEGAWELDHLGHGALTFTMKNAGNAHVDFSKLARAVQENDQKYLRLALQAFVPNPVTYLTEGDQHSIDLLNGHYVKVKGAGSIEVLGAVSLTQLLDALERARDADADEDVAL
jgi:hypothetical protein